MKMSNNLSISKSVESAIFSDFGQVNSTKVSDVYRFSVNESGVFTADLTGLTGDADVRLIHDITNNGQIDRFQEEIIAWKWERGTENESIRSFIESGEYFLQVFSYNNELADYQVTTDFQASSTDSRDFKIQVDRIDSDELRNRVGLSDGEIGQLNSAIDNAVQRWELVIPYSSKSKGETLRIELKLKDFGDDASAKARAGGRTITYNINPDSLKNNNDFKNPLAFESTIVHEIGHILGIAKSKSPWKKFIDEDKGIYKPNTHAGAAFGDLLGTYQQNSVPITTNEGKGSDFSHWNKRVFGNEVMTHAAGGGEALSELTIAAIHDIGWNVNYGAAQSYSNPLKQASINLLIEEIQALDEDGIGGKPNFYSKVEIDGEKYLQTANEQAASDFSPVYPNWSFPKNVFYNTNNTQNWIPITIRLFDKDKGAVFDGTRKDDHVDISQNKDERNLNLEYNLTTQDLRNRDDNKITYAPDANGRFFSEGDNLTELVWGDFDKDGKRDVQKGPSDKVRIRFSIQTILSLATILPSKILQMNPISRINNTFLLKHISGSAGSEVIDIAAHGLTQRFGPGNLNGEFLSIKAVDRGVGSKIVLDGVLTKANLKGGKGNDIIEIINSEDGSTQASSLSGGAGDDVLTGGAGNDTIHGGLGDDTIYGGLGNDTLQGGTGGDAMYGQAGDDVYHVDSADDQVYEPADSGIDTVFAYVNHTLSDHVETLVLRDSVYHGTGNNRNNNIRGNSSQNLLEGLAGDDNLDGYYGNDTLKGGDGNDDLNGGYGNDDLFGDAGNDKLAGNIGDDVLSGGLGDDLLLGGAGKDTFVFNSIEEGLDTITDFSQLEKDTIRIVSSGFGSSLPTGTVNSSQFVLGISSVNTDSRFIYDQSKGLLSFDSDGIGTAAAAQIAFLSNNADLAYSDIVVV